MKELGQDKWLAVQWGEHGGLSRTLRDKIFISFPFYPLSPILPVSFFDLLSK